MEKNLNFSTFNGYNYFFFNKYILYFENNLFLLYHNLILKFNLLKKNKSKKYSTFLF